MPRVNIVLAVLALLATVSLSARPHIIREHVSIPSFHASKSSNGTITFPTSTSLPPVLRGLNLVVTKHARKILIANTPYLPDSGAAIFLKSKLFVFFPAPRIRVHLTVSSITKTTLRLSGVALHVFPRPFGLRIHASRLSVPAGVAAVKKALEANPDGPRLVTVVDHSAAATSVGQVLPESSVVVFGNPVIGSQLWTRRPRIGVELPLELLIATSPLGKVYVAWNTASLLGVRFGLPKEVASVLETIDGALAGLAGVAADRKFKPSGRRFDKGRFPKRDGLKVGKVSGNAVEAFERLVDALEAAPPVGIAYQIPHDVSAMNAGLETNGKINRVVVFGNPALGTGIMQRAFTAAIDLPAKMGVWTRRKGATVFRVGYTTPKWIGQRHGVDVPEMLSEALNNFAAVALGA